MCIGDMVNMDTGSDRTTSRNGSFDDHSYFSAKTSSLWNRPSWLGKRTVCISVSRENVVTVPICGVSPPVKVINKSLPITLTAAWIVKPSLVTSTIVSFPY